MIEPDGVVGRDVTLLVGVGAVDGLGPAVWAVGRLDGRRECVERVIVGVAAGLAESEVPDCGVLPE